MSEVEKFDPSKLMNGVRDRIKATFVSLIPDAQWEELVKGECEKYFQPFKEINGYDHRNAKRYSDFQLTCLDVMNEVAKEKLKVVLAKYDSSVWSHDEPVVNELILETLKKNASQLFAAMIGNQVQKVLQEIKNRNY